MGKFDDQKNNNGSDQRPTMNTLYDNLAKVIVDYRNQFPGIRPIGFDDCDDIAVRWFVKLVEPHGRRESPQRERMQAKQDRYVWRWPYQTRLVSYLLAYLRADEKLQRLVIAARKNKIFWRGDEYTVFEKIIEEYYIMREIGVEEYRLIALRGRDALIDQMTNY